MLIGTYNIVETQYYNGYGEYVADMYAGLTDHKFLSYQLAIMNGTGINIWDDNATT